MKLKKLDKRMTGYGDFVYSVDFPVNRGKVLMDFFEVREWCFEQWGRSAEIDIWQKFPQIQNPAWAWERGEFNKTYRCRIFLASDKEAHWFTLRWV